MENTKLKKEKIKYIPKSYICMNVCMYIYVYIYRYIYIYIHNVNHSQSNRSHIIDNKTIDFPRKLWGHNEVLCLLTLNKFFQLLWS